jgi:hypothetical protein
VRGVGRQEPKDPTRQAAFAARPREGRRERRHDFPSPLSPTPVVRPLKAGPPEHGGGRPLGVAPGAGRPALSVRLAQASPGADNLSGDFRLAHPHPVADGHGELHVCH